MTERDRVERLRHWVRNLTTWSHWKEALVLRDGVTMVVGGC